MSSSNLTSVLCCAMLSYRRFFITLNLGIFSNRDTINFSDVLIPVFI